MKNLLLLLFPLSLVAQNVSIGGWKDYLSYNSASYIAEANEMIYCVANGGLFYIQKKDNSINRISKITGLSDVDIKQVAYCHELNTTIIAYNNCNIDLLTNNTIINISDIKRKEILGNKTIHNITIKSPYAYISSSFGLIVLNLERHEISDTYNIGDGVSLYEINGCAIKGDSILCATSEGVFYAYANSQNLSDYNSWNILTEYENKETYDNIICGENNTIYGDYSIKTTSISYNNGYFLTTEANKVIVRRDSVFYQELTDSTLENVKYAWVDNENHIWVADSVNGLLKFENYVFIERYIPEGPIRNDVYSLEFAEKKLYQCHGGHANFGLNSLIYDGVSIKNKYDEWINYDSYKLGNARDILEVAVKDGTEFYASWYDGISEVKAGGLVTKHGYANTGGVLDTVYYSNNRIRISDLKFDSYGNMWALSSEVNHPIVVKTLDNKWYSYTMNQSQVDLFFDNLLIDQNNQKWGVLARGNGLFVYDDKNTLENSNDDEYKILNTNIGSGNLPSLYTYCIVEDLEGEIWVGTDKGIAVFYNPSNIFSGYNYDAQQILITEGSYGQYLLSEEKVKCIAIDGGNRKWIGTEKSGVFLLSNNGQEQVLHFTKKNSPLYSDNIVDITINHDNGEVFIGTEKGVISYRSDATQGRVNQESVKIFPNPVYEYYRGPIAISELVSNANVKITDITGSLVYETTANGGSATWNGKNKNAERVPSGIYIVLSSDFSGKETVVGKILFFH